MTWNPEKFSNYSFSEYPQSPEHQEIGYADPRFYEARPEVREAPHFAPPVLQAPPFSEYGPYQYRNPPAVQMSEYRGPASLENYTMDVGAEQREAAQNGNVRPTTGRKSGLAGLGGLGAVIALLAKFGLASVSALVSVVIYSALFGWTFAIGLVVLLFLHEMGHALVMKLKGIPVGGLIFIPMLGAAVFMRRMPRSARDEAEVGIAGPIAGALASSVCLLIALSSPESPRVWASLAYFGFLMNLFNLAPVVPLDGGRIAGAIDRRMWIVGLVVLIAVQIWEWINGTSSIWLLLIIVMAATQFWTRNQGTNTPEAQTYYAVPLNERIIIALAYFGLAIALAVGMSMAQGMMHLPL